MHQHHHEQRPGEASDRPLRGDLERGAGSGRIVFLDAFSGIAGDMFVAALLDLGVPLQPIETALSGLPVEGYRIEIPNVVRSGIVGRQFRVHIDQAQPERTYKQIRSILEESSLPDGARAMALEAFRLLGEAEAAVHGMPLEEVHFHEVGAVDSIVDVVAVAVALDHLGARVVATPLPMGKGTIHSRHGTLPLPAPATVACLRGVPTYDAGIDGELVTPTGACLVATMASEYVHWPRVEPERVGWGGGARELPDRPNLLRLVLGAPTTRFAKGSSETDTPFIVLETNVDDMTAEVAAYAMERALESGALDVWTTPIGMKKGRPALMISALVQRAAAESLARLLLTETTSLGVRMRAIERVERPRRMIIVETPFGNIPVKVADGDGLPSNVAPEFEACREATLAHRVPAKEVLRELD
jgi:uncharacterized protein (TIGR00299 family) protein